MAEKRDSKKLTYEQLEDFARQLSEQNTNLRKKLNEVNMLTSFKRLDYLFEIIKTKDVFDSEFYNNCVDEIKLSMSISDIENEDTNSK